SWSVPMSPTVAAFFDTSPPVAIHESRHCATGSGRDQKSGSAGCDYSDSGTQTKAMAYPK
ncbi:MAG: hypothetical protein ACRC4K_17300, partial [Plesiomonas shigelloides]